MAVFSGFIIHIRARTENKIPYKLLAIITFVIVPSNFCDSPLNQPDKRIPTVSIEKMRSGSAEASRIDTFHDKLQYCQQVKYRQSPDPIK